MTAIRKSVVFAPETTFGSGEPDYAHADGLTQDKPYCQFPPGTFISHTGARQAQSVYTTGSKRRAGAVYGSFSGTWNISFPFDYNYLEPLTMIFEMTATADVTNDAFDPFTQLGTTSGTSYPSGSTLRFFRKDNSKRVKSFVIREKILNEMAGGSIGSDEITTLKGCVAKSFNVTRSASGSQMNIEISGVYSDQKTELGSLDATDYDMSTTMDGLAQYSCMFMDGITDDDYVGDVDSHSFSIDNNANLVYNTCTPIAKQYYEGQTNVSWNAQTYSNDPAKKFKLRPNSGGYKGSDWPVLQPLGKGLKPMTYATWATYSTSLRDQPAGSTIDTYKEAIQASDHSFVACAKNSTVKSMTWQKGDGSKMMDSLSSVECDEIRLRIVNKSPNVWTHACASPTFADAKVFNIYCNDGTTLLESYTVYDNVNITVSVDDESHVTFTSSNTTLVPNHTVEILVPTGYDLAGLTSTQMGSTCDIATADGQTTTTVSTAGEFKYYTVYTPHSQP
jgi:hypothetical protein